MPKVKPKIYDITPKVSSRLGVFPGDRPYQLKTALDFKTGDHLMLSSIDTTLHIGAHADGPNHYSATGASIAERDLAIYMGRCLVLHAAVAGAERVQKKHLAAKWHDSVNLKAERILVRTLSFPNPEVWNSDFASLSPELIEEWGKVGVRLVGIDTPSIDPEDSQKMESHKAVEKYDLAILEGVILEQVPEGYYTLVALPLKLEGADASPVRAILFSDPDLLTFDP